MSKLRSGSSRAKQRNDTSAKARFNNAPRRVSMKATTGVYMGIPFDSLEEMAFLQWAEELKRAGYIKSIERAESFLLCDPMEIHYAQQLVTKSKPMSQVILHGHSYTPEFKIIWDKKAGDKIIGLVKQSKKFDKLFLGEHSFEHFMTYVEIKPMFDQNNMERLFKVNQKWMWDKHDIFVNLVKCPELFAKTFTPQSYLTTKTGKTRLIKWKIKGIYEYLKK